VPYRCRSGPLSLVAIARRWSRPRTPIRSAATDRAAPVPVHIVYAGTGLHGCREIRVLVRDQLVEPLGAQDDVDRGRKTTPRELRRPAANNDRGALL
jgi:hypothetical protein